MYTLIPNFNIEVGEKLLNSNNLWVDFNGVISIFLHEIIVNHPESLEHLTINFKLN